MSKAGILMVALALTAGCSDDDTTPTGPSTTGPVVFSVQLSAANEVPPVTNAESGGRGTVTITFDVPRDAAGTPSGNGTATFTMQLSGFPAGTPAIGAHIHPGAAGVNGGVILNTGLSQAAPVVLADGTANLTIQNIPLSRDLAAQIMANPAGYYFNVHTPTNPGGAIRGQLVRP
jgi:hypothetical protein